MRSLGIVLAAVFCAIGVAGCAVQADPTQTDPTGTTPDGKETTTDPTDPTPAGKEVTTDPTPDGKEVTSKTSSAVTPCTPSVGPVLLSNGQVAFLGACWPVVVNEADEVLVILAASIPGYGTVEVSNALFNVSVESGWIVGALPIPAGYCGNNWNFFLEAISAVNPSQQAISPSYFHC